MRLTITLFTLLSLLCPLIAPAQCGFDALHRHRMQTDKQYAASVAESIRQIQSLQAASAAAKQDIAGGDTTITIPVVLHVIHNGEPIGSPLNPTDSQLIEWIAYTDAAFNASWPAYPGPGNGGVRTRIRFALAHTDRDCRPFSGILRADGSGIPGYTQYGIAMPGGPGYGASEVAVKRLSYRDWSDYFNIWLVSRTDAAASGYAHYPSSTNMYRHGPVVVAQTAVAGSDVLVHELGHSLGLFHTFEGDNDGTQCPPAANCATTGDFICDTEPGIRYPLCGIYTNPCTGLPYGLVRKNFMNYTACKADQFTPGQAAVMWMNATRMYPSAYSLAMDSPRPQQLLVPAACIPAGAPGFDSLLAICGPLRVGFAAIDRASYPCRDENASVYVDNTCMYRTDVTAGQSYTLSVATGSISQAVRAYLDWNNDGIFQVPDEELLSARSVPGRATTAVVQIPRHIATQNAPLRLRVVAESGAVPPGPCTALRDGQAEDYAVTIRPALGLPSAAGNPAILTVAPNPAGAGFGVSCGHAPKASLQVFDITGRLVETRLLSEAGTAQFETATWRDGIYFLRLRAGDRFYSQRVQIRHD